MSQITYVCPTCDSLIFIDRSSEEESEEWGKFSAECIECGEQFRYLERNSDGSWTASSGARLRPLDATPSGAEE